MRSKVVRRSLALAVAAVLGFAMVATVLGDAADPGTITASISGFTATVSGTWTWSSQKAPCTDRWVGWAINWDDPVDAGNPVSNGYSVGTATDNTVHTNQDCGSAIPGGKGVQGSWGSLSHTYPRAGTYTVCAVMYDIHIDKGRPTDPKSVVAGGSGRNTDNSVDGSHESPGGPGCTSVTIQSASNIVVQKTVNRTTASPGDTLAYTITLQNTGGTAGSVDVSDDISALLAHGSFVACSNGCIGTSSLAWSGITVGAGATTTLTYSVNLDSSGWNSGTVSLPNTVVVPSSNCASGSGNSACRTTTTVSTSPNLVVHKTVSATTANPGDTLNYTIAIQNTGSGSATGVTVADDISALLAHGSFVSCTGSCTGSATLAWSGLSIAAGATSTLSYSVKLESTGWASGTVNLPNTVVVPNSDCASGSSNSACTTSTMVTALANLVVHKTVSATTANPGDTLNYTITVQNTGNAQASRASVTDDISALLANGSLASCSGGCTGSQVLSWTGLTIDPGATIALTYSIRLGSSGWPAGTTTLPNTAVVPNSDCASGSSNPACRTSTTVTTRANLVVHKSVDASNANPGDSLAYTISVQNTGNAGATGVVVADDISALLAHASFGSASSGATLTGSTLEWDGLTFAAGSSQTFTFSIRLATGGWPVGTTTLANTVVVAGSDCAAGSSNPACRVTTTVIPNYGLAITKGVGTASGGPFTPSLNTTSGTVVWYSITVSNTGNADLGGMIATDSLGLPLGSQCPAIPSTLAAGASWTCTYFRTATTGTTVNTSSADSSQTGSVTDSATVVAAPPPAPGIHIVKTASVTSLPVGGGGVTYTYAVTNTGNVPLSNVTVTDDRCSPVNLTGGDSNGNSRLDTTETWTFTCAATLTQTTTNTATATGVYGTLRATGSDTATVIVIVGSPALHIEKSATPTQLPVGGGTATYTYVVTNVGNAALANVTIRDDACGPVTYVSGDTNSNTRLDLTEAWRFTCSAKLTQTTTNTATASGSYNGSQVSDTAAATVTVPANAPGIHIVKAANPTSLPAGGGPVTYTYVVTNTGNTPLGNVTVTDNECAGVQLVGGDTNGNGKLDLSETWHYSCTATITATTTNVATVTASSGGTQVQDTDSATVAVTASNAAINVVKTASPTGLPAAGGSVTYTYVVTNKGNVPLSNISVVDDKCPNVTPTGGDTNSNGKLDLGESWTYSCTTTLTVTTTNTVLATGFVGATPVTDTDTALVTVGTPTTPTPRVRITKTAAPVTLPPGGGSVTYTYAITNKGDVPLSGVSVSDNTCAPVTFSGGDTNNDGKLDLSETWVYTCTTTVSKDTTNIGTVTAHYNGQTLTAIDMATVTVAPPAPTPPPATAPTTAPSGAPNVSPAPTTTGPAGTESPGASPAGGVLGATSPPKGTPPPELTGLGGGPTGTTPSGMVMILILLTGIAASVVILTLSKQTTGI
ncbi:MAG TPA: hypothetical protein VNF73_03930 [Candidatus Saccharimonadales bacterium]|nr:hypothetical protein [Candidatus Saccharimonadales bacterium]